MVKLRHKGLLVIGMNREEIERLQHGYPIPIKLDDVNLKGQMVLVIPGKDNNQLNRVMQDVATRYDNGATNVIEIAKQLPKGSLN